MQSIWKESTNLPTFPALEEDIRTDVLIIGGGITGLLCAYMLEQAGADYALVEANNICCGITQSTTAKITSQHGLIYNKLTKKFDEKTAKIFLEANEKAVVRFRKLTQNIDCDFEDKNAFVYSVDKPTKIQQEINALQKIGFHTRFVSSLPLPFPVAGAVCFPKQAQFHPLKFLSAIAGGLHIYEHTTVRELVGLTAITNKGKIHAEKIVVATHFPFLNKHGLYPLKLYQHRSYVIALENVPKLDGMYVDEAINGLSFRSHQDLLLLDGGSHRTGKQGGGWKELENFARKYYPEARAKYRWATQDCISLDGLPYIGQYSKNTEGLYVATGFNKWGMTSAMMSATILCDMLQNKYSPYAEVFSPSRSMFHTQLAINGVESAIRFLTPSAKRCPHLGCALKWNAFEHTWDCPCHGSRFTEDGKLIDKPRIRIDATFSF